MVIPNSVKTIERNAFSDNENLKTVTIGSGIKKIDYEAFLSCEELTDVYCKAKIVPDAKYGEWGSFRYCNLQYVTLHVPATRIRAYKSKAPWSDFKQIVAIK